MRGAGCVRALFPPTLAPPATLLTAKSVPHSPFTLDAPKSDGTQSPVRLFCFVFINHRIFLSAELFPRALPRRSEAKGNGTSGRLVTGAFSSVSLALRARLASLRASVRAAHLLHYE